MQIVPLEPQHIPAAAEIFAANFHRQRAAVPLLPDTLADVNAVAQRISELADACPTFVALEEERVVGYLGGWIIDHFRDTARRAAYAPEWAHGADPAHQRSIYGGLYRAASRAWFEAGCSTHAITTLAVDEAARETWFWNGFGMLIVDAVRALEVWNAACPPGYTLRKADLSEVEALADLEAEHWGHYLQPPVLMTPNGGDDAAGFTRFLGQPANAAWTAWHGADLAAYIRFEASSFGSADTVNGAGTVAITGAYTRPAHRGQGLAPALLSAAMADYHRQGYARCAVDFESFNLEAAAFWPRFFTPVCFSLMRVPEREPENIS